MSDRKRLLLIGATTGYQTRSFDDAAARLGFELVLATDRCHVLDDPWGDRAIALRFEDPERAAERLARGSASGRNRRGGRSAGLHRRAGRRAHGDRVQFARFGAGMPRQISCARAVPGGGDAGARVPARRDRRRAGPGRGRCQVSVRSEAARTLGQPRASSAPTIPRSSPPRSAELLPCWPIRTSRASTTSRAASFKWRASSKAASSRSKAF